MTRDLSFRLNGVIYDLEQAIRCSNDNKVCFSTGFVQSHIELLHVRRQRKLD